VSGESDCARTESARSSPPQSSYQRYNGLHKLNGLTPEEEESTVTDVMIDEIPAEVPEAEAVTGGLELRRPTLLGVSASPCTGVRRGGVFAARCWAVILLVVENSGRRRGQGFRGGVQLARRRLSLRNS
jgi:hypothetical protein